MIWKGLNVPKLDHKPNKYPKPEKIQKTKKYPKYIQIPEIPKFYTDLTWRPEILPKYPNYVSENIKFTRTRNYTQKSESGT